MLPFRARFEKSLDEMVCHWDPQHIDGFECSFGELIWTENYGEILSQWHGLTFAFMDIWYHFIYKIKIDNHHKQIFKTCIN